MYTSGIQVNSNTTFFNQCIEKITVPISSKITEFACKVLEKHNDLIISTSKKVEAVDNDFIAFAVVTVVIFICLQAFRSMEQAQK